MFRSILFPSLAAAATASPAAPPAMHVVEGDGIRYEYRATITRRGFIHLDGRVADTGERIRLTLNRAGWVSGDFGTSRVSFSIGRARRDRLAAELRAPAPTVAARSEPAVAAAAE